MNKTYRTTLILNPNHPDKAAALGWLNHLQKERPEKSISDIIAELLNENRSRVQEEVDIVSAVSDLTSVVKELTKEMRQMALQGNIQAVPAKPAKHEEKPDMEETNKVLNMFGF